MSALAHGLDGFWLGVATHLWQSSLVVAIVALLARLLRDSSARLLYGLYIVAVVKLLLPLPLLGRLTGGLFEPTTEAGATWFAPRAILDPIGVAVVSPADTSSTMALGIILTAIWVCGLSVVLWRHVRASRAQCAPAPPDLAVHRDEFAVLVTALGRNGIPLSAVRLRPGRGTPSVSGWLRPTVVIPRKILNELQDDELSAVLSHEREHLRRRDPLRYALLAALCSLYWFYPPMAWLARRIRETNEMACDEAVLASGMPVSTYRRGLARTIQLGLGLNTPAAQAGILGHHSSLLHRRLERLRSARRYEAMPSHRIALVAVVLVVFAASLWPLPHAGTDDSAAGTKPFEEIVPADLQVTVGPDQANVAEALDEIARVTGLRFTYDPSLIEVPLRIELRNVAAIEALKSLATEASLSYREVDDNTIEVRRIFLAGMDGITNPKLIGESMVQPEYPPEAFEGRVDATVILQAVIDSSGVVSEIEVLRNSRSDIEAFAESAKAAVTQWRYEPATRAGVPVGVYFTVFVEFKPEASSDAGLATPENR